MSRLKNVRDSEDGKSYRQGYEDGAKDAFDHAELDAFYAGVGYGKKLAGDKHIGFKNDEERKRFEEGIQAKDKHFNSYRAEPMGFFERIISFFFGKKEKRYVRTGNKREESYKKVKRTKSERKKSYKKFKRNKRKEKRYNKRRTKYQNKRSKR